LARKQQGHEKKGSLGFVQGLDNMIRIISGVRTGCAMKSTCGSSN
jgi:hypothetical protein